MARVKKKWALVAALGLFAAGAHWLKPHLGSSAEDTYGRLKPPAPPSHERRKLDSAHELAKDFVTVVRYLEHGQAYFRAFQKGSHTVAENEEFVKFLENYEKEWELAKKEADTLKRWVHEQGSLDAAARPAE